MTKKSKFFLSINSYNISNSKQVYLNRNLDIFSFFNYENPKKYINTAIIILIYEHS
jgi:hypothetical protein